MPSPAPACPPPPPTGPADPRTARRDALAARLTPERWARYQAVAAARTRHLTVLLEDLFQPHNASAILRTCDALGVQDVHVVETRNAFRPNDEIALGAAGWLDVHRHADPAAAVAALRATGHRIVAAALRDDSLPPSEVPLDRPLALCLGTEKDGLSATLLAAADVVVRIPMVGFTRSLNVSVSAGILLHHLLHRLRASPGWELSAADQQTLLLRWLEATAPGAALSPLPPPAPAASAPPPAP